MKISYENILSVLYSNFKLIEGNNKKYFVDEQGKIAATVDENLIVMYYDFQKYSEEIWNHDGKVAVIFAKNFNVNGNLADVICIDGLIGSTNDYKLYSNFAISRNFNCEVKHFNDNKVKPIIIDKQKSAKLVGYRIINGTQLSASSEECQLGNCGDIHSKYGVVDFNICDAIFMEKCKVNREEEGFDLNIANIKGVCPHTDYEEIYNYYRKKNDWYYTIGSRTRGSQETREYTEKRRKSTVDYGNIHMLANSLDYIMDKTYLAGNGLTNSKKLEMIWILRQILMNQPEAMDQAKAPEYVLSHYNFNIRKCDKHKS